MSKTIINLKVGQQESIKDKYRRLNPKYKLRLQLNALLGFEATEADLRIINVYRVFCETFPDAFPADATVAEYAKEYDRRTTQKTKRKIDGIIVGWPKKVHPP